MTVEPHKRRRIRRPVLAGIILLLFLAAALASSQEASVEYQVKAAFLLNFVKFVEWPASAFAAADTPITICVLGDNPFGDTLVQLTTDETVQGRKVSVQHTRTVPRAGACHLLFITRSERDRAARIVADLRGAGILTVADSPRFLEQGGMINFFIEERRVRFEVNPDAAEAAGLRVSSRLLRVARVMPSTKGRP